jgi:hypothetical protein
MSLGSICMIVRESAPGLSESQVKAVALVCLKVYVRASRLARKGG